MYVTDIVSRAHKRASVIHRCFLSLDVELLVRACKVYVRPLLEHNSVIRLPNTLQDIDAIECVQRRFTKRLRGLHDYSYEARLKYLDLQSLELRRLILRSHLVLYDCFRACRC